MNKQITSMRGRFRTYEDYATVTFRKGFRNDEIAEAVIVKAEMFESCYLENKGNAKFNLKKLPLAAQFSPIYASLAGDYNNDGNLDVVAVGNFFSTEVQTGRYDARGSVLLQGDGTGNFIATPAGISDNLDNKSIANIAIAHDRMALIVGSNSDSVRIFSINGNPKVVELEASDAYMIITEHDNRQYRQEAYYGHSYLSQGSRKFTVPENAKSITIYSFDGKARILNF
jgi:hypothetical protein